eukprot:6173210-Pleurochrysis_carterae.AAC.2
MEARYNKNKASYSQSTRLLRGDRGKKSSGSQCRQALRGINSRTRRNRAMRHECRCQNMQMRMNDNKSLRNLQSQIDSRDRGSSVSIARLPKSSILPI